MYFDNAVWAAVDADMIFETSVAKAECEKALAEAEKAGTEADRAAKHAHILAKRAEQARAGASEVQAATARVCAAPTTSSLLWQAEYMPGGSDSSRETGTGRTTNMTSDAFGRAAPTTTAPTTSAPTNVAPTTTAPNWANRRGPTLQRVDAEAVAEEANAAATRACSASTSFSIVSGSCLLDTNSTSVTTLNFPSEYGPNENCSITMSADGFVSTTSFATESGYDCLTMNGTRYNGSNDPINRAVSSRATVLWESDYVVQNQGWKLYYSAEAPPTAPPTTPPPTIPTLPARSALSTR